MANSIIVDKLKRDFVQLMYDEAAGVTPGDSDNYFYIVVGRSQQWDPANSLDAPVPVPRARERDIKQFRYGLQSAKAVEGFSYVVPMIDWTAGTFYAAYNDNIVSQTQSYYVRTTDNNIYVCIRSGKNAYGASQNSTIKPDHINNTLTPELDGYVWKYLYTISTQDANRFLTTAFMPVRFVDSDFAVANPSYATQWAVAEAANPKQIVGYRVTDGGGPYTDSGIDITVVGNGTGAKARAVLNASGAIAAIEVGDSANAPINNCMGTGYNYANIVIDNTLLAGGGTSATAVPIFGPVNGLGYDPRDDLRSTSIMFNIKPVGNVDGTWVTGTRGYRQYGLVKNIELPDSDTKFTDTSGIIADRMRFTENLSSGAISLSVDQKIHGQTSGAVAWLDFWDDSDTLWYHQDEDTGFTAFDSTGETIKIQQGDQVSNTLTMNTLVTPNIDRYSGDVYFISNGDVVARDVGQTEDIKVVVKL